MIDEHEYDDMIQRQAPMMGRSGATAAHRFTHDTHLFEAAGYI